MIKDYDFSNFHIRFYMTKDNFYGHLRGIWTSIQSSVQISRLIDTTHLMCPQEVQKACYLQNYADVIQLQSVRKGDWPGCLLWSGGETWVRVESPFFTKAETTQAVLSLGQDMGHKLKEGRLSLKRCQLSKNRVRLLTKRETNSKYLQHPPPLKKGIFLISSRIQWH